MSDLVRVPTRWSRAVTDSEGKRARADNGAYLNEWVGSERWLNPDHVIDVHANDGGSVIVLASVYSTGSASASVKVDSPESPCQIVARLRGEEM